MPNWELMKRECLGYFLCSFDPTSPRKRTEAIFRQVLKRSYQEDIVNDFLDSQLAILQSLLVEEFNARFDNGRPVRYVIADTSGIGTAVRGNQADFQLKQYAFQDALHRLAASEFENLAAVVLRRVGCEEVFFTPLSHDQGVDSFGYQNVVPETRYGVVHQLIWIAQAKHYLSTNVSTNDIRDLVGSRGLLLAKAFSTVDERYIELSIRHFAPIAIALITTEEIPSSVRRLAENAGVYVYAASDLFYLLNPGNKTIDVDSLRRMLRKESKSIQTLT